MPIVSISSPEQLAMFEDNLQGRLAALEEDGAGESADAQDIQMTLDLMGTAGPNFPQDLEYFDSNIERQLALTAGDVGQFPASADRPS